MYIYIYIAKNDTRTFQCQVVYQLKYPATESIFVKRAEIAPQD